MTTDTEHLTGQMHAILTVMLALIDSHPDPARLCGCMEGIQIEPPQSGEPPDAYLDAMRETIAQLKAHATRAKK